MQLGAFSVSLNVKDIHRSKAFYENLGFEASFGDLTQNWLIMKNGPHVIGLFQGMLEKNTLTFNPGWDQDAQPLESFSDVREIQQALEQQGLELEQGVEADTQGPGYLMLSDPDGNPILIDQHV
jgi:lactoylglutathione lyase